MFAFCCDIHNHIVDITLIINHRSKKHGYYMPCNKTSNYHLFKWYTFELLVRKIKYCPSCVTSIRQLFCILGIFFGNLIGRRRQVRLPAPVEAKRSRVALHHDRLLHLLLCRKRSASVRLCLQPHDEGERTNCVFPRAHTSCQCYMFIIRIIPGKVEGKQTNVQMQQ